MVEGETTQESGAPEAPEGAAPTPAAEPAPETTTETSAQAVTESPPVETAAGPVLDFAHLRGFQSVEAPAPELAAREDYAAELAKELAARAARFARSVDESIVLSSEGVMRWLGEPVARVVAGDDLLHPRAVLLADEALAGEDRAAVETRVNLWLSAHIRKVLGALLALVEAQDLPEAAKTLAGKIAEALGVLDRERVRNEVRALDQSARGALRKLGVRFGSLYIYMPLLLKPAARGLCVLLWTLKRGTETGADRLLAFASAGRTSFANEGLLSPDAYRVAGFRLCGERVVRVDIIERLSDLIRAALPDHMRQGSRPPSEAYGFLITPQMTSLTGCSGEAFASILRSLNFEPAKVSKAAFEAANRRAPTEPIKPAAEAAGAETGEAEAAAEPVEASEIEAAGEAEAVAAEADTAPEAEAAGEAEAAAVEAEAAPEPEAAVEPEPVAAEAETPSEAVAAAEPEAAAAEAEAAVETIETDASAETEVAVEAVAAADTPVAEAAADEEIEVWRPAPRRPRAPPRPQGAEREQRQGHHGKPHQHHRRQGQPGPKPEGEAAAAEARPQGPRPPRPERRDDGPRRFEGARKEERNRDERRPQKDFAPRREQRPADPDSPFAKLAALKPLLERRDKRP